METSFDTFGPLMVEQLREQVSNLLAAVHLLTPVIREQRDERYDQYLAIMNQSLYRLLRLTGNIEFAALPRGAEDLRSAPLDLAGLCRDLSSEVIPLAERAGVVFRYEESCSSLLTSGDAVLLRRMLLNLISNALRAAGAGGEAGLRFTAHRERCTLTIWDSGSGFDSSVPDPEDLTRRPDGAGLGLELHQLHRLAEDILHASGGPLIHVVCHGAGGRDGVDRRHFRERVGDIGGCLVAVHGLEFLEAHAVSLLFSILSGRTA